jgi:hypothetical protein
MGKRGIFHGLIVPDLNSEQFPLFPLLRANKMEAKKTVLSDLFTNLIDLKKTPLCW